MLLCSCVAVLRVWFVGGNNNGVEQSFIDTPPEFYTKTDVKKSENQNQLFDQDVDVCS